MSADLQSQLEIYVTDILENSGWRIRDIDKVDVQSHVEITTPSNFTIVVDAPHGVINLLGSLVNRGDIIQPGDGSILSLNPMGDICIVDCDKWNNPGFEYGQLITNAPALAHCLVKYLKLKVGEKERL